VLEARRHDVKRHRQAMLTIWIVALLISGLFTLDTGRIMSATVFGR
jgi:uncharacterized membrane protein